jgi:hypothetical protein
MDYLYFLSRLDKVRKEDVKHMSILQKMLVKFKKWKRKDFPSAIPEYVSVPIQALQKLFEGQQFQNEAILLSVQKIEGDGNCLYQSLAESTVVKERIPKFKSYEAMERYKYVRDVMYGFAKGNQILSFMIWKHYVPKRGDKNFKEDTEKFESWVETLKENFRWGGQAEYTLFAYAFKCHVVCLRQLKARLELVCTRDFHPKISNEIDKKRFVHMGETFVSPSNVIFIWHHNFTKPRQKLGDEENGYGNHYSFLSYKKKQKKEIYHDTYLFEYTPLPPVGVINLSSPEDAKRMTKKEDRKDTVEVRREHILLTTKSKQVLAKPESPIPSPTTSKRTPTRSTQSKQVSTKHTPPFQHKSSAKRKATPESTVATRLEEKQKKNRLDAANNILVETATDLNEKVLAGINKDNDGGMVTIIPTSANANEFNNEIIEYDLPPIIRVPVSSVMRDEMDIGIFDKYLFFETKDNDGKGNCFYNSILNSNAFSPAVTSAEDDCKYDSLLAMIEDLQ